MFYPTLLLLVAIVFCGPQPPKGPQVSELPGSILSFFEGEFDFVQTSSSDNMKSLSIKFRAENANLTLDDNEDIDLESNSFIDALIGVIETSSVSLDDVDDEIEIDDDDNDESFQQIKLLFTDESSGLFQATLPGGEEFSTLFEFSFQPHRISGKPWTHLISSGAFYGEDGSFVPSAKSNSQYSFVISSVGSCVLTIFTPQGIETLHGSKTILTPPATFFQKYGMMVMMGGMMFFNRWLMKKMGPAPEGQPGQPAQPTTAPTTKKTN